MTMLKRFLPGESVSSIVHDAVEVIDLSEWVHLTRLHLQEVVLLSYEMKPRMRLRQEVMSTVRAHTDKSLHHHFVDYLLLCPILYFVFVITSESMWSKSGHCVSSMHWENSQVFLGGSHGNTTSSQAHFLFAGNYYYDVLQKYLI